MPRNPASTDNPIDARALALRLARECRHIVQGCLREDEWRDADEAFAEVIRAGLDTILERKNR